MKWIYFERLVEFKVERTFHSMHKMTNDHINFQSKPMKVLLAIQIVSHKFADALEYWMRKKIIIRWSSRKNRIHPKLC